MIHGKRNKGIVCAEGGQWSNQRKHVIESLRRLGMVKFGESRDEMEKRISTGVRELVATLRARIDGGSCEINPLHEFFHSLGNVMNDFVFGVKYDKDDATWKYLQDLQEEGVKYIGVSGPVNFLPVLRYLPNNRKTIKYLLDGKTKTHEIYDKIIGKCRATFDQYPSCLLKNFLLEKIRLQGNPSAEYYTDQQLRHLLADMFGAGVDTTLTTMRWFLLYTAKYTEIQAKLWEEMSQSLPTLDDIEKLPLLRAAIMETQRIRSVVPLGIPHGTVETTQVKEYKIDQNTMVIPLLWNVHMNEDDWDEPEKFDPYR